MFVGVLLVFQLETLLVKLPQQGGGVLFMQVHGWSGLNSENEAIEVLLSFMTRPTSPVIIITGHEKDMDQLVKSYPGLYGQSTWKV